ncbi:hypothetical protein MIND_00168400 [Mycena indigotica]|uniref:Cytochrome P450 n=1 Tax=Mycena indigotica TaxID=2126181 RepID=A0A8H6TEZ5_9AGAR|nr:uncharacterized protein MIND_00168400 [Mycena indigotica]KAF7316493.1 hypothetical protein MIND_00168400 [Mycena indigotica]
MRTTSNILVIAFNYACEIMTTYPGRTVSGLTAALFVYRIFLYPTFLSPLRNVPGPGLQNPVLGQYLTVIQEEVCIPMREWTKVHGRTVRYFGLFGKERILFISPEALHQMFVQEWLSYPRPAFLRNILGLVAGYGLLTVTGDEHKQLRKAMNPAFSLSNLMAQTEMYYDHIESLVEILKEQLRNASGEHIVPIYPWAGKLTLDIICDTAFGYKTRSLHDTDNELATAYHQLVSLQSLRNIAQLAAFMSLPGFAKFTTSEWGYRNRRILRFLPSGGSLELLVDCMHRIRGISAQMLREKIVDLSVSPHDIGTKKDIMSLLVQARQAELELNPTTTDVISDKAMIDQILTFLSAGHETTASGISWTLWLLAKDPESQHRLREEIAPVYAANPRPDYRTLKSLSWLDCVINESLRVLPPVPLTIREAGKTAYVDGVLVPKGTIITCPIRVVNTWKHVWGEDAEDFRPSRWLEPMSKDYNPTYSHFPFIAGPHACIGKTMAVSEMKAVIFALIANFEFEPAYEGQIARSAAAITMKPEDGMPLRVTAICRRESE